jgi:ferric-dicitrate binding protein FerR (iron transport regulator)
MNEEIDIILSRYFSGEATKKELHTLDMWLSQSEENEKYFHEMTKLYQYAGQTEVLSDIDTERALAQFKFYMSRKQNNSRKTLSDTRKVWRIAAAIAILVVAGFSPFYFIQPSKTVQLMAVDTQKEFTIYENVDVTLFPGTELVYHKNTKHQVHLKGKAHFNVQSDHSKKLVIQAGETYIEDIGTVFSVDASAPERSITVEVTEGEIWFYTEKNSGIYLKANQSAVYDVQSKQFNIIAESVLIEELPVTEIIFHDMPLSEAIEIIKTLYNVDIKINSKALNEILLNASFDENESVEYVLEIISATLSGQLSKKDGKYVITL